MQKTTMHAGRLCFTTFSALLQTEWILNIEFLRNSFMWLYFLDASPVLTGFHKTMLSFITYKQVSLFDFSSQSMMPYAHSKFCFERTAMWFGPWCETRTSKIFFIVALEILTCFCMLQKYWTNISHLEIIVEIGFTIEVGFPGRHWVL